MQDHLLENIEAQYDFMIEEKKGTLFDQVAVLESLTVINHRDLGLSHQNYFKKGVTN